jgi:hypothetical protein
MLSQNDKLNQVRRFTFLLNLSATGVISKQEMELKPARLQSPWASILLIAASRFIFVGRHRQVFFRRPFEPNNFNGFLVNPLEIFGLEPIQAARANVRADDLLDGLASHIVQFLERAQGMC